ncbi:MAG: flagellar assembly protein A, partial [Campylobacterota bacterium]|nr:flagellar assembly protein A [Campylobacterota bacterium]
MTHFSSFKKLSTDVKQTLSEAAKDRKISLKEVDFDLLKVETLVKTPKHKEWTIVEEPLEKLFEEKLLRSTLLEVRQEYTIRIKPTEISPLFKDVMMEIQVNKIKSKAIVLFKKGSVFPDTPQLAKKIRNEIYKRKLLLGFVVQHYENSLNSNILKFSKLIKPQVPLAKEIKFSICTSTLPLAAVDDDVVLHYKNKTQEDSSLITGVDVDDLVFEYIKPQKGRNGRGCHANQITIPEPKVTHIHHAPDPETIRIEEDERSIKYYAKRDGYFKNENGIIKISQEISLSSASFKDTGSINANNNQEISLNIAKTHHSKDAVGSGVNINLKEVNVEGTVGSNASVKAVDLSVGEQTHRNSQLEAVEHAKVKLHRGKLKAKTAQIEILENGTVEAEEVNVEKMLGGEIIAKRVFIKELTSNTTIIASESIEILHIS